jgi:hypothetical protein
MKLFQVKDRDTSISTVERIYGYSLFMLILLGLIFRVRFFLTGRSLWLDEAMLALNILHRSFAGLLDQPMEYGQSSPIGYVFSVKALTLLLGDSEYAFRLYSLLVGCAVLLLMALFFKRHLGKMGALVSIALFAIGPHLVYYSAEVKQYIGDVAASLIFIMIAFQLIDEQATLKRFLLWGGVGALLLWFSHPAVFSAAGVGVTLLLHYWVSKNRTKLTWAMLCGAIWGISLVALYFVNLRHLASSELLLDFWQEGFMPLPPWMHLGWFAQTWQALLHDPLGITANPMIVFFIFAAGIYFLFRRDWRFGTVLCLPLVFALLASGLHKYSLIGRLLLFTTPAFILALGAGIDGLGSLFKNRYLALSIQIAAALYLFIAPFQVSMDGFLHPKYAEHIKPTMEYLRDHRKDGDLIYIYYNAGPAFRFYAPKYRMDSSEYRIGNDRSANPLAPFNEVDALIGHKRVWLIFTHVYENGAFNERDFILTAVDQAGKKKREYRVPETSVYLYFYDLK